VGSVAAKASTRHEAIRKFFTKTPFLDGQGKQAEAAAEVEGNVRRNLRMALCACYQVYCEVISGLPGLILPQSDLTKWQIDLLVDSDDFPLIVILMVVVARQCSESRSSIKLCALV
jgi:hypothetical protein